MVLLEVEEENLEVVEIVEINHSPKSRVLWREDTFSIGIVYIHDNAVLR